MSTSGGPNITTNGLVVHLDAANDKSFRGEPTVNLAFNFSNKHRTWRRRGSGSAPLTIIDDTKIEINLEVDDSQNNDSWLYYPSFQNAIPGSQYTWTVYVEELFQFKSSNNNQFFIQVRDSNNNPISESRVNEIKKGDILTTSFTNPGDNSSFARISLGFGGSILEGDRLHCILKFQFEQKPYATPFVNGTRGNTVATGGGWADRSGNNNHGQLINSPLYVNQNLGALNFDGTNSSITIPFDSSMDFSKAQTICMWLKPTTGSNSTRRNPYNQAYGGSGTLTHEPNQTINYYFGTHGGNSSPYVGRNSGFTVAPNELAFITVTRSQSLNLCRWYKNGQAGNFSNAGGYSSTNNGNSPILIANGYTSRFLGDIYGVFIYNRYMTQDEVQQMYNATKGRYGL